MTDKIIPMTYLDQAGLSPLYRPAAVADKPIEQHGGAGKPISPQRDIARYDASRAAISNMAYKGLDRLLGSGITVKDYLSSDKKSGISKDGPAKYDVGLSSIESVYSTVYSSALPQQLYQPSQVSH